MSILMSIRVDPEAAVPLATQLSGQITWLLANGDLEEGDQLPPIRELAERLGINLHTVRAAYLQLDEAGLVELRRGRRARVLRYKPSAAASNAPDIPSFTVGVIIPDFSTFYAPFVRAVESGAAERSSMTFICNAHEDPLEAVAYVNRLVAQQVDGIVVASLPLARDVDRAGGIPVVHVDSPGSEGFGVEFDLMESQYEVTSHVIGHGHTRIGFLTPPTSLANVGPKHAGFRRALIEAGIAPDDQLEIEVSGFAMSSGEDGARALLSLPDPPTAIVAATDHLAFGAFHAVTSRGLSVPDDIALVGNDGTEMSGILRPGLTTMEMPVARAGNEALAMLQTLIDGDEPDPRRIVLPSQLKVRESCGSHPR